MKTYKEYAIENKELILDCIQKKLSKTKIAHLIGCNPKTLAKCFEYLNINYNYYDALHPVENNKFCPHCQQNKVLDDFYFSNGKYSPYCKECTKEREREKYKNKKLQIDQWKIDQGGCKKCGEMRPYVLDMHHINPQEKDFSISDAIRLGFFTTKFQEELNKCIILCANCHREFHHLELEQGLTIEEYLQK